QKASEVDVAITQEQWKSLTPLQRFALIKLSRPSHENKNFLPAAKEFGLSQ
ncbi:MAG: nitrate reductase associated protein, partial [Xenococcaceae cyanobacterium]